MLGGSRRLLKQFVWNHHRLVPRVTRRLRQVEERVVERGTKRIVPLSLATALAVAILLGYSLLTPVAWWLRLTRLQVKAQVRRWAVSS